MFRCVSLTALLAVAVAVAACGSSGDDSCAVGAAGCRCTSWGACDDGLTCSDGVCGGPGAGQAGTASASSAGHQWCLRVGKGARVWWMSQKNPEQFGSPVRRLLSRCLPQL